jgi:hypothetical protein
MPRSTLIYSILSVAPDHSPQVAQSPLSLSPRTRRPLTLTPTSGRYPMFTGLTMSARMSTIPKNTSTRKMLKLTGISLR